MSDPTPSGVVKVQSQGPAGLVGLWDRHGEMDDRVDNCVLPREILVVNAQLRPRT